MTGRSGRGKPYDRDGKLQGPDRQLNDLMTKAANVVRVGRVEEVDYEKRMARIRIGDKDQENASYLTDWLRIGSDRAGTTTISRQISKDEQVAVYAPDGRTENAFIGHSLHNEENESPSNKEKYGQTTYPDGAVLGYDDEKHAFTHKLPEGGSYNVDAGKTAAVKSAEGIGLDAGKNVDIKGGVSVEIEGSQNVKVDGNVVRIDGAESASIFGGGARLSLSRGKATIEGIDHFEISAGGCVFTMMGGKISFSAARIEHGGDDIGRTHRHGGVREGTSKTGTPE